MAHLVEAKGDEDKAMDVDEVTDARFASILHSRALVSPNEREYELITERLHNLMSEGRGECIFEVGLGSDPPSNDEEMNGQPAAEDTEAASGLNKADYDASVATLTSISGSLDSECVLLRERILSGGSSGSEVPPEARRIGQYLIRKCADPKVKLTLVKFTLVQLLYFVNFFR